MRMGTLPIVAPTGGLKDTVEARQGCRVSRVCASRYRMFRAQGIPNLAIIAQKRSLTELAVLRAD